ncbi:MAG: PfkB family carbohydrate kinase, partial [Alphaproteobacteria bacterium]
MTVVDTTGAGDAFLGAFAAFSTEGFTPEKIL